MNIQHLFYLVEISRCGSINKAAKNLYVTQPSISQAIMKMEENLGFTILERTPKGIQFTAEGLELLCYAKQLLEHVETIEDHFSRKNKEPVVHFNVASQHYAFTVAAFIKFINQHKAESFSMTIREMKTSEVIDDIHTQRSSIGTIILSETTERFITRLLDMKDIKFHKIMSVRPHVFIRKNHPLANEESICIEQLAEYPCISYEQGKDSLNFVEESIFIPKPRQAIYVQDRGTMVNIIVNTNGYNIGTGCLLQGITDDNFVSVPISGYSDVMNIGWIKLKNLSMTKEMIEFVNLLHMYLDTCYTGHGDTKKRATDLGL